MTRFMMSLDDAVDLVLFAFENAENGDIFVQKSPAATVGLLAETLKDLCSNNKSKIRIIGTRHGEKLFESLLTKEEMAKALDLEHYYRIPSDNRDLNYEKYFEKGEKKITDADEYHSHNTHQLNQQELKQILMSLSEISDSLKKWGVK
jgi:UDP-glucose 4-epimerase